MNKVRHYLHRESVEGDDLKPPSDAPIPIRAWLRPAGEGVAMGDGPTRPIGRWTAMIEDGERNDTLEGDFEALVSVARKRDVAEFFVWSVARRTFQRFTAANVTVID